MLKIKNSTLKIQHLILSFLLLFLLPCMALAQDLHSRSKKAIALYEKARNLNRAGNWFSSLNLLKQALDKDHSFDEAILLTHQILIKRGQIARADSLYQKLESEVAPEFRNQMLLDGAYYHYSEGHYEKALRLKNQIEGEVKAIDHRLYELVKKSIDYAFKEKQHPREVTFTELPSPLNDHPQQYFPSITSNDMLVFTVRRKGGRGDENIFFSNKKAGAWTKPASISANINTDRNEGTATISADGRTLVFTGCNKRGGVGSCDLYLAEHIAGNWTKPRLLPKTINTRYWESQPSLSQDGRQLYFVSKRPDGYGGQDIWWSRKVKGEWQPALNLGKIINTGFDDCSPYIHPDGQTLFFASRGRVGFGGYDLYKTTRLNLKQWVEPENLGYPINTHRDQIGYTISSDGWAYYSGGDYDREARLYRFKMPAELLPAKPLYALNGTVSDEITGQALAAEVIVADISTDSTLLVSASEPEEGRFRLLMDSNDNARLYIKKKGYLLFRADMQELFARGTEAEIALKPLKVGDKVVLQNILFQLNSAALDEKATKELDLAVDFILENPEVKVEIAGHTDSRGDENYNLELSESRASSVYTYFLQKGIPKESLIFKGYGETRPIVSGSDPNAAALNRRIELVIASIEE